MTGGVWIIRRTVDCLLHLGNPIPLRQPVSPSQSTRGFVLLVSLIALLAGAKAVLFDTIDPDCFWHLKVAEQLQADGIRPLVDRLSFASIRTAWSPYSWLAELGMKQVWDLGGYRLAILIQTLMQAMLVLLLAGSCRIASGARSRQTRFLPLVSVAKEEQPPQPSYLACGFSAALMAFISLPYLSFRPVTASLVLLGVCMLLLVRDRARGERTRAVWSIPLITVLIVNLHLNAVFVPMWLGVLFMGALWERFMIAAPPEQEEACQRAGRYFILTLLAIAACCCTPMLPGMIETALHYSQSDPMVAGGYIAEMRPFFLGTFGSVGAIIVGGSVLAICCRFKRFRPGERLWLAAAIILLSQWGRFAPIFALTVGPMFAVAIGDRLSDRVLARPTLQFGLTAMLLLAAGRVFGDFPSADRPLAEWMNRHGVDAPGYPAEAAQFVTTTVQRRTGRLISEFAWGGYLEYEVGDRFQLLLDGRTQLFPPDFWRATYLDGEETRSQFLAQVDADAAVLQAGSSLFRRSLVRAGWRSVWKDPVGRSEVLLPPEKPIPLPAEAAVTASDKSKKKSIFSSILPE